MFCRPQALKQLQTIPQRKARTMENQENTKRLDGYKAIIIGGTGAVGGAALREFLLSPKCAGVTHIGRRKVELEESFGTLLSNDLILQRRSIQKTHSTCGGHQ
jgi:hypothetical protein